MQNKSISIIIPNFNGIEHLKICLPSIALQTNRQYHTIVVDNGSTDGSTAFIKSNFPDTQIISLDKNTGFAHAVNEGIKFSIGQFNDPYILLLNNDIELTNDFLELAVRCFEESPEADILAVKMMNFYERNKIDDTGNFLTRKGGTPYPRGNGQIDEGQFDSREYIFSACAGAAFYKSVIFKDAGLFDEDFFAYIEDIDLGFRAQLLGFKCLYEPKAVCYHKRGGSSISTLKFQLRMNERNIIWTRLKNYPLSLYIKYQPRFMLARLNKFYLIFRNYGLGTLLSAIYGYVEGILKMPLQVKKRSHIQSGRKVPVNYITSLFR
jgi:GT2 family glycosyltransferase